MSHWDEYNYVTTAIWFLGGKNGVFTIYEPPGFPIFIALFFKIFGARDFVAIATSGAFAVMTVALVTLIGTRFFGLQVGIVAPILLVISPLFIAYSRMALTDVAFTFFFTASVFTMYVALRSGRLIHLISAGLLFAACNSIKYNGIMALLIPILYLPAMMIGTKKGELHKNGRRYLQYLVIMCLPTLVLGLVFLFILGVGSSIRDMASFHALRFLTTDTFARGFSRFEAAAIQPHSGQLSIHPLGEAAFYLEVIADWVPLPIVILAIIGLAMRKPAENPHLFTLFWAAFAFVEVSSIPARYSRALLPVLPPLALLAGVGLTRLVSIQPFRWSKPRLNRLFRTGMAVFLITMVLGGCLIPLMQTVAISHNAYRQVGQILQSAAGNSTVLAETQPVIAFYYKTTFGDMTEANLTNANFLVVDFIGQLRYQPTIQLLEKQGRLKLFMSVHNDASDFVYLDSTNFHRLKTWNYTNIMIYRVENVTQKATG